MDNINDKIGNVSDIADKMNEMKKMNDMTKMGDMSKMADMNKCADLCDLPLAMAYVPFQKWREIYEPEVGFSRGAIFAELDKPFIGERMVLNGK